MRKDDIIKIGDSREYVLRTRCHYINNISLYRRELNEMSRFVNDKSNSAYGLALPQIGHMVRGYVCRFGDRTEIFINPKITFRGHSKVGKEACLSEPGVEKLVLRNEAITVKYTSIDGELKELKLAGFYARIVQHEQNHLDGILLSDK